MHSFPKWVLIAMLSVLVLPVRAQRAALPPEIESSGADVYMRHCATCHDHPIGRIPPRESLEITRSPDFVLRALNVGAMRDIASGLGRDQKVAVAAYLTKAMSGGGGDIDIDANHCRSTPSPLTLGNSSWNGWGGHGTENLRYQPDPGLTAAQVGRLKLKWVFALPGGASSQPTIVGGRAFVPSMSGVVFSLDVLTGCTYWVSNLGAPVRTPIVIGQLPSGNFAAFLGDLNGMEHTLDAETGKVLWQTRIENHPAVRLTGAPALFNGRLYQPVSSFEEPYTRNASYPCCTFRGSLVALDATTGDILWKTYSISKPPKPLGDGQHIGPAGGAIWASPTVDASRGLIYAGTGNSYIAPADAGTDAVIAFDARTGAKRWVRQLTSHDWLVAGCWHRPKIKCSLKPGPDFDLSGSPMLLKLKDGKDVLVVTSKSGLVFGLDPDHGGRIRWHTRVGQGSELGGIEWGGASDGDRVYVTVADPSAFGGTPMPNISALSLGGTRLWATPAPTPVCAWLTPCSGAQSAAPAVMPGVVFSGAWDGHERAYSTVDGKILWDFDTGTGFDSVNGGKTTGGSVDQGGQVLAEGTLLVISGARNGRYGNGLLAFTVDGK